jgi:hypothetical protein
MIIPENTFAWIEELYAYHGFDALDNPETEQLIHDECIAEGYTVVDVDYDTVTVDSDHFKGYHSISIDCHGEPRPSEIGTYYLKETDFEVETCAVGIGVLEDEVREHHDSEPSGAAALTVGERNPQLGGL